jgi:hypothetical protein
VLLESRVPVVDVAVGDTSSWKLCLRFGFDIVLV